MYGRLTIICYLIALSSVSQNLIPDSSFEWKSGCPQFLNESHLLTQWFSVPSQYGTPDYFNRCCSQGLPANVPSNALGYENAASGNGYIGLVLIEANALNYREYMEVKLIEPLQADSLYRFSFKYSRSDRSRYATNGFGIYFSEKLVIGQVGNQFEPLPFNPQLKSDSFLTNSEGWTEMEFLYEAEGGEEYMVIGNFIDSNYVSYVEVEVLGTSFERSYVYFDDFVMKKINCGITLDLGSDTSFCAGDSIVLNAYSSKNASYKWKGNSTLDSMVIHQSGEYWVQVQKNECVLHDTIFVSQYPNPKVELGNDTVLCIGTKLLKSAYNTQAWYLWQDGSTQSNFRISEPGIYWVKASIGQCADSDTLSVKYDEPPAVDFWNDGIICDGGDATLVAQGSHGTYLWNDMTTNSTLKIYHPGHYWVQIKNSCGEKEFHIDVKSQLCDCILSSPNAFTPNGDGINDAFNVSHGCELADFKLIIRDRYSRIVFRTTNPSDSWNGQFNQNDLPSGQYIYQLTYQFEGMEEIQEQKVLMLFR